jgi:hypothetical protein
MKKLGIITGIEINIDTYQKILNFSADTLDECFSYISVSISVSVVIIRFVYLR